MPCSFVILALLLTADPQQILVQFGPQFQPASVEARDARVELDRDRQALQVQFGHKQSWPGITFKAPGGAWDLSPYGQVTVEIGNTGEQEGRFGVRVDTPDTQGKSVALQQNVTLGPGETRQVRVPIRAKMPPQLADKLFGMRGFPGGWQPDRGIDASHITQITVFAAKPTVDHRLRLGPLVAAGTRPMAPPDDPAKLFPMIDTFGQYMHADWPGKTHSVEDLARQRQREAADLAAHPGPDDWDQYGGWKAGPQLKATGFFRAEKHQGKWWLVDPEGRLFWSHGIDCVRTSTAVTAITDRENWFADLPAKDSPLAQFYGKGWGAAHGYYEKKGYRTYGFSAANLLRKYGDDWTQAAGQMAHRRLRSWAMNTIANWSDMEIARLHRTPYVATVGSKSRSIEGSSGYWRKFPDPFDPAFATSMVEQMAADKLSPGDPWCLGYFVHNELSWGDEVSLSLAALASPADQPAKLAFLADLKAKYATVDKLNAAWDTQHPTWDALAQSTTPPDKKKAYDDLTAFYTRIAEQYFRCCREAIKQAAPQQLYLGCRFAWSNDRAVRAAAKYCDVVSFNRYRDTADDFRLPEGVDMPVVIGEFHFGALDRGMFHTGLRPTESQAARAEAYRRYVNGALDNTWLVGTHWFQYADQATTGRTDGENYQIGFLDICDTPYQETIDACREVGSQMYRRRLGGP